MLSLGNQAAFVKVGPTIWTQDLTGRQQLDSRMSLNFSPELLLGKQTQAPRPGFFNWWLSQAGLGEECQLKNPRRSRGFGYRVSNPIEVRRAKRGKTARGTNIRPNHWYDPVVYAALQFHVRLQKKYVSQQAMIYKSFIVIAITPY